MPKKWELASPIIKNYIKEHGDQYLNELSNTLNISPYVIKTAAEKGGFSDHILSGMSPKQKYERNKKLSQAVKNQVKSGEFQKVHIYDESWKEKVKAGTESFRNDPKRKFEAANKYNESCKIKYGQNYRAVFQQKAKSTKKQRYGMEGYNNTEKQKKTKLKKYGDPNYNNRSKAMATFNEKYGGCGNASPVLLKKTQKTCLERYGVKTNLISNDPKLNGHDSIIKRFGSDKARYEYTIKKGMDTKLQKYGCEFWSNADKAKTTMLKKYNASSYLETREARISKSNKYQDYFYNLLVNLFDEFEIIKEYKSDKYPWFCDFYVKRRNLYIEYDFHWSHGPHPFDVKNYEDIILFNKYSSRLRAGKSSYAQVIKTWCIDDANKLETAVRNKLNYITVYGNSYEEMDVYAYVGGIFSKSEGSSFKAKLNISRALA